METCEEVFGKHPTSVFYTIRVILRFVSNLERRCQPTYHSKHCRTHISENSSVKLPTNSEIDRFKSCPPNGRNPAKKTLASKSALICEFDPERGCVGKLSLPALD